MPRPRLFSFAALPVLLGLASVSCKQDKQPSTAPLELIPAEIQGVYGRTAEDAPGMQVGPSGFDFGQMKLTIHEGKMEGDTVRVERATVQWQKLEPKTCTGTIARQGDRLLLSLYEVGGAQDKCDSVLDAQWHRWEQLDELPAMLQGRYGVVSIDPKGLRLELDWLDERMTTETIYRLPGSNDVRVELLIKDAKVAYEDLDGEQVEAECTGTVKLDEGWLTTKFWVPKRLVPEPGSEAAADPELQAKLENNERSCNGWIGRAVKWEVSMDGLPKAPIRKQIKDGEVSLAISADEVVLASPGLRCEQDLWRTETVQSQAGWRGGQFGGQRMTLGKAAPTAVSEDCKVNLRLWCERQDGVAAAEVELDAAPAERVAACMETAEHELCPESITVQAISDIRYKFHVEPQTFNQIACVDTTGDFSVSNE